MKFVFLFLIHFSIALYASDYPLGELPKRVTMPNGCVRAVKPSQVAMAGAPSWSDWWKLMNFFHSNFAIMEQEGHEIILRSNVQNCFTCALEPNCTSHYSKVSEGFLVLFDFFDASYRKIAGDLELNDYFDSEHTVREITRSNLARYNVQSARLYDPYLAIYNKMATAWINFLKGRFCTQQPEDGNAGIIQWGSAENERFFFHVDSGMAYIVLPHAINWEQPLSLVNFYYNTSSVERLRSFVCSQTHGIQATSFLRIMKLNQGIGGRTLKDELFGFKVIEGAFGENPYSSASFFGGSPENQLGNVHDINSPIYPLIAQILKGRESVLLPLVDDSLDELDVRALELEIAAILAKGDSDSKTQEAEQNAASAAAYVPPLATVDELVEPEMAEDCVLSKAPGLGEEATPKPRKPKIKNSKIDFVCDSFVNSDSWGQYDDRQKLAEMKKQAIAEQVAREHAKVAARVQKLLEAERAKRSGGKSKKGGHQQLQKPQDAHAMSASEPLTDEALIQATRAAEKELDVRRVRMRDTAKLMAAMISVIPQERLQLITENTRGSHGVKHFEGVGVLTAVRPHGRSDLTIPAYRAKSIVWHLHDMLMEISKITEITDFSRLK